MGHSSLSFISKIKLDENKYSQFLDFFTCFFELNYFAKVSHGNKILFEMIFLLVVVCETTSTVVASGVFADAEKVILWKTFC